MYAGNIVATQQGQGGSAADTNSWVVSTATYVQQKLINLVWDGDARLGQII